MFTTHTTLKEANLTHPRLTAILCCEDNLMALSWQMPISREPFRYAVAVREENETHGMLLKQGAFTLNFLPLEYCKAVDLTGRYHASERDKLMDSGLHLYERDVHGNMIFQEADTVFSCRVCDTYEKGDHTLFIADVEMILQNTTPKTAPMLFMGRGRYGSLDEIVEVPKC